jgi:hypothetical protein
VKQLREAVLEIFQQKYPELVNPPWKNLFDKYKDAWGPDGMDGVKVVWSVPGTSTFIAIETSWAVGKNRVGLNWFEGRSFQHILDMLLDEWLNPQKTPCSRYFLACERSINKWIKLDNVEGGPLAGEIGATLTGIPDDATLREWKELAALALVYDADDIDEVTGVNNDDVGNTDFEAL